jgi:hypothetical protein
VHDNRVAVLWIRLIGICSVVAGLIFIALAVVSMRPRPEGTHDLRYLLAVGIYVVVVGVGTTLLRRVFAVMLVFPLTVAALLIGAGSLLRVPWPASLGGILMSAVLCVPAVVLFRQSSRLR